MHEIPYDVAELIAVHIDQLDRLSGLLDRRSQDRRSVHENVRKTARCIARALGAEEDRTLLEDWFFAAISSVDPRSLLLQSKNQAADSALQEFAQLFNDVDYRPLVLGSIAAWLVQSESSNKARVMRLLYKDLTQRDLPKEFGLLRAVELKLDMIDDMERASNFLLDVDGPIFARLKKYYTGYFHQIQKRYFDDAEAHAAAEKIASDAGLKEEDSTFH